MSAPFSITAATLYEWLSSDMPPAVVDVRDSDRIGGHVKGSINVPSQQFRQNVNQLKEQLKDESRVVFYCQLSQQRGPTCAAEYARLSPASQKVYVLKGGFSSWAHEYGHDETHTQDYIADLY